MEALEIIAKLLTAATSSSTSACQTFGCNTTPVDTHNKQANHRITTTETTILGYSFDRLYQLLQAAKSLGERIVPPEFVSFLIHTNHPLRFCSLPYHQNPFLPSDCAIGLSRSTCMQLAGANGNNDENTLPIPDSRDINVTSFISSNGDDSSPTPVPY